MPCCLALIILTLLYFNAIFSLFYFILFTVLHGYIVSVLCGLSEHLLVQPYLGVLVDSDNVYMVLHIIIFSFSLSPNKLIDWLIEYISSCWCSVFCTHTSIVMDTTPGEFRWALAPDLAAWSSDRDREAMSNIRQLRPAIEQAQTITQVASSWSDDVWPERGARISSPWTLRRKKTYRWSVINSYQSPNTEEYEAPIRSSVIQRRRRTSGYLSDIERIAENSDEELQTYSIRGFRSTKRTLGDESQSTQPRGKTESIPRRASVQIDDRHRSPSYRKTKTDPASVRAKDTQHKRSS